MALTIAALDAHAAGEDDRLRAVLADVSTESIDDVRGFVTYLAGMALGAVLPPPCEDTDTYAFDVVLMGRPQTPTTSLIGALFQCVHRGDAAALSAVFAGADADELAEAQMLLLSFVGDAIAASEEAEQS